MKLACEQTFIERATSIAFSFVDQQRAMWSSIWPLGHCAVSSLLLCPILRAGTSNPKWRVAIGRVRVSDRLHQHAWCQLPNGMIVDITYGQFVPELLTTPLRVAIALDELRDYYVYRELPLQSEDEARHSIRSMRNSDGWMPGSIIKRRFEEMERQDEDLQDLWASEA